MVIRVEKLNNVSYRKRALELVSLSCSIRIKYIESKIRESRREADSVWDSFKNTGIADSVIESLYNGKLVKVDRYIQEKEYYDKVKNGEIICFSLDCECLNVDWDYVLCYIKSFLDEGKKVFFCVDGNMLRKNNDSKVNYTYTQEELDNLGKIDSLLKKYNQEGIYFNERSKCKSYYDFEKLYTYDEVKSANEQIDIIVNKIKELNLSPFETMLYIHEYITNNFIYDKEYSNIQNPRVLPGIFKYNCIVCSGFASIIKAIIDRLDDPNLKCGLVGCTYRDVESEAELQYQYSNHTHNLIYIKDELYDINGYYVEDATKNKRNVNRVKGYGVSCCLHPIEDLFHYNNIEYYQRFYNSREKNILEIAVDPLFRNPKRYKNKERIAQIYKKYKNMSVPITIDKYSRALKVVAPYFNINVDSEIEESKRVANLLFDEDATNCFVDRNLKKVI